MKNNLQARALAIVMRATDVPEAERLAFAESACAGDAELLAEVRSLLDAHANAGAFMSDPTAGHPDAMAVAARTLAAPALPMGQMIGRYKLLQLIGEGGFGTVYLAEQQHPVRRRVALKIIKLGMDTKQVIARFEAERQALAMMDHPNIAKVLDAGSTDAGRPYFVMELVRGVPITDYCDTNNLPLTERLKLFVQVCRAVQHAHQKGIIHRDIKPNNVMVAMAEGNPVPKVIDFGIAKATNQQLTEKTIFTEFRQMIGTPQYMSPEQAEMAGIDIDTRSDVYSLGVLLYELLVGSTPFDPKELRSKAYGEMQRMIREVEPPKPSTRLSSMLETLPSIAAHRRIEPRRLGQILRGELDWIVMRAIEKDRTRRYETANDLAADVARYLDDEPVLACPPSASYRVRKLVRRNKGPVLATLVVLLVLIGGVVGTSLQAVRADGLRQIAVAERAVAVGERKEKEAALAAETAARKQAMAALASLTDEVVERQLARQPALGAADRAFLKKLVAHYEAFAALKGDTSESRTVRAEGHFRLGQLRAKLGEHDGAVASFERANALCQKLAADSPAVPEHRGALASIHLNLGVQFAVVGRTVKAEAEYRQAIAVSEQLAADFPAVPGYRDTLSASHSDLGLLLSGMHQHAAAEIEHRQAIAVSEQLAADFPAVPEYRGALSSGHNGFGMLLADLGKHDEAEAEYREAIGVGKQLAADFPAAPEYRATLSASHNNLALLLSDMKRLTEAGVEYREAIAVSTQLAGDFPAVPGYRDFLARSHGNFGGLLATLHKNTEAEVEHRQAIAVSEQLAADFPAVPGYRATLSRNHNNLALLLSDLHQHAEAQIEHRRAIAVSKQLTIDFPAVPEHAVDLGGACCNLGNLLSAGGKPAEALQWFGNAVENLTPVVKREPPVFGARQFLRNSYWGRARAFDKLNRFADAVADWDRTVELSGRGEIELQTRLGRAKSVIRSGDHVRGLAEADALVAIPGLPPGAFYDLAGACALASAAAKDDTALQERYAARAVELLAGAESRQYFVRPGSVEELKGASVVDALRARSDFRALMARLDRATTRPATLPFTRPATRPATRDEAAAEHRRLITIQLRLAADFPGVVRHAVDLGGTCCNFGHFLCDGGDPASALPWYDHAVRTLSPVVQREPGLVTAQLFLRNSHLGRATALEQLGRFADAVPDWDRAVELDSGGAKTEIAWRRTVCLIRARVDARAFAAADALTTPAAASPTNIYTLACAFALASAAEASAGGGPGAGDRYAARALDLLARAEAGKYFLSRSKAELMKWDPELDPVRTRPEYVALVARLDAAFAARDAARLARGVGPFGGSPPTVPGVVRAAAFDEGGEGVAFHDSNDVPVGRGPRPHEPVFLDDCADGDGSGHSVGGTNGGEWLAYTVNVARDGEYVLDARVAASEGGTSLLVKFGDAGDAVPLEVPKTGGWQRWQTVPGGRVIRLKAGRQVMRVTFQADGGGLAGNLNWIEVRPAEPAAGAATAPATRRSATAPSPAGR